MHASRAGRCDGSVVRSGWDLPLSWVVGRVGLAPSAAQESIAPARRVARGPPCDKSATDVSNFKSLEPLRLAAHGVGRRSTTVVAPACAATLTVPDGPFRPAGVAVT